VRSFICSYVSPLTFASHFTQRKSWIQRRYTTDTYTLSHRSPSAGLPTLAIVCRGGVHGPPRRVPLPRGCAIRFVSLYKSAVGCFASSRVVSRSLLSDSPHLEFLGPKIRTLHRTVLLRASSIRHRLATYPPSRLTASITVIPLLRRILKPMAAIGRSATDWYSNEGTGSLRHIRLAEECLMIFHTKMQSS
jgi:hypothetical protein